MRSNRRDFLRGAVQTSAVLSFGVLAPDFLVRAAAGERDQSSDTVLVIVQLTGGNDGLNTVVPYSEDVYHRSRPELRLSADQVLKIDDRLGFHPALTGLRELFDRGELSVVQGIGYPKPNRSHFESMDIWHTCHPKETRGPRGWLGRSLDENRSHAGGDVPALHLGVERQPLALAADRVRVPSISSIDRFRLQAGVPLQGAVGDLTKAERSSENELLGFVGTSAAAALAASRRVESALGSYKAAMEYPDSALAEKLRTVARLIDSGLETRVYYVTLDGFDTHAQQSDAHAALLTQLSGALHAFVKDMDGHGHGDRVLVSCFSEFGRRVKENASAGTDHGAAAPMILAGGRVKAGIIGDHPSLTDLEDGDLKYQCDFRRVYAALLENWLRWPSAPALGGDWLPADVFAV